MTWPLGSKKELTDQRGAAGDALQKVQRRVGAQWCVFEEVDGFRDAPVYLVIRIGGARQQKELAVSALEEPLDEQIGVLVEGEAGSLSSASVWQTTLPKTSSSKCVSWPLGWSIGFETIDIVRGAVGVSGVKALDHRDFEATLVVFPLQPVCRWGTRFTSGSLSGP